MTAKLENINKFRRLGLRRRPTYEEIIGLIDENETITGLRAPHLFENKMPAGQQVHF